MKKFFDRFGRQMSALTLFVLGILGAALLLGYPTMLLWNYVIPHIFGLITLDFWHAWALLALSGLLFKPMIVTPSNTK